MTEDKRAWQEERRARWNGWKRVPALSVLGKVPSCPITHLPTGPAAGRVSVMKTDRKPGRSTAAPKQTSGMTVVARDVRPDDRGRIALGRALKDLEDASFNVYRDDDGRIVLDPQVSIPASEAWLFRNKSALASLRRGLQQAASGKTRVTPHP